jgi:hypothetical protein
MATAVTSTVVGSNFGFMWGTLWFNEAQATTSSLLFLILSSLGAGQFVNIGQKRWIVSFISSITPLRYVVERTFRRIVKDQQYEGFILNMFGFTLGDEECLNTLHMFALVFFVLGWVILVYRTKRL